MEHLVRPGPKFVPTLRQSVMPFQKSAQRGQALPKGHGCENGVPAS